MEFLKMLEGVRTPFLDMFFSAVTHLGEETIFIVVGLLFFWCVNKKQGFYILSVGFVGTVLNQFLKLWFRIPRPWVRDPDFTIVESARAAATGYSFPSGHTQSAVGVFGCIARSGKRKAVRLLCIAVCLLVPLSRMYLGVHTPADVGVSFGIAVILIFVMYPFTEWAMKKKGHMRVFFGMLAGLAVFYLLFVLLYPFPADVDLENYSNGVKNAYKMLGAVLGLWAAFEVDDRYIHFETEAVWWGQILKLVLGLLLVLTIKSGLKAPLRTLLAGQDLADGVRYFLITAFAGGIWPLTFQLFPKGRSRKWI